VVVTGICIWIFFITSGSVNSRRLKGAGEGILLLWLVCSVLKVFASPLLLKGEMESPMLMGVNNSVPGRSN
jgi:hypothetical protein